MPAFADLVLVGRVVKPQGRKGEVKVEPYTDREDRFPRLARAFVPAPGGGSREVEIEGCWPHKDHFVLKLRGVDSITQAETLLHGAMLRLEAGDASVLPELSNIKVATARSVIAATQAAVAALGNPGLTRHHPLERHLRDALCVRVHPPQEDTVVLASGRRVLGV